mgnify:CR=1 FL=1|jgi:hypothetical protein
MSSFSTPPSRQETAPEHRIEHARKAGASMRPDAGELVASVTLDLATLDASHDDTPPDAPVQTLVGHAKRLAPRVRKRWKALRKSKLKPDAAASIEAGVRLLREAETRWGNVRALARRAAPQATRDAVTLGRSDLLQAARLFCEDDPAVQRVLGDLSGGTTDAERVADVARLLEVYDTHAACFDGTDVTPARVQAIREAVEALHDESTGVEAVDGVGGEALTEEAREALRLRNRAFWFVAAIEREVCKRAQYVYRAVANERALFSLYTTQYQKQLRGRRTAESPEGPAPSAPEGTDDPTPNP